MRGDPITVVQAAVASAAIAASFLAVAALMVRRARNPKAKPRDELERATLRKLENPTRRERLWFFVAVAVAAAAPWMTYLLQGDKS
jgi:hypothetical protein